MRSAPAADLRERQFVFYAAAALAALAIVAYANSFSAPLLFDDWVTILKNPRLRHVWPIWEALSPPEDTGVGGRPIANLSFVLNYALTGESVAGFHAVNLLIHLGAGLALFGLVRRTLLRLKWEARTCAWVAFAAAAMWTLQPLQTQSVTYISQRTESLMGLFYFLTLYSFARWTEKNAAWWWSLVAVGACFAGVATKEGMATAPVMVFLYDWVFVAGTAEKAWRARARLYLALAASWLLLAMLTRGLDSRGVGVGHGMSRGAYLLIEFRAIVRYFALSLWPSPLVFDYGTDLQTNAAVPVLCGAAVIAFAVGTLVALRRCPPLGFLGAWFLITLAPTSSVVPLPLQPISENRVYVPSAAIVVALVIGGYLCVRKRGLAALLLALVALPWLTARRNADYRSEVAIWTDTVAKRPGSARAHSNLGQALQGAGRLAEARAEQEQALKIRPDYTEARANLAAALGQLGDVDAALQNARRATEIDPQNAHAFYNLGVAYRQKGDIPAAMAAYETAIKLNPNLLEAQSNLALLLIAAGRTAEAVAHGEAALRINPQSADGRFVVGCGLMLADRPAEAMPQFAEVVRQYPNHVDAWVYLGVTLQQLNRVPEAISSYETALRLNPNLPVARENLDKLRAFNAGLTAPVLSK